MPKKSAKPKPRTNWKQRALHCEEVIGVQNVLANRHRNRVEQLARGLKYWQDRAAETRGELEQMAARAESAEKQNALLLEERDLGRMVDKLIPTITGLIPVISAELDPPTHWQRFKSWLSAWKVELLLLMLILGILAGLVAFAYWPRG